MLLTTIVFLPLVAGIITLLAPDRAARWIAALFTAAVLLLSLWLYFGLLGNGSPNFGSVTSPQWYIDLPWINVAIGSFHFKVDYALGADGLSIPMLILNGLLSFLAVIGSWRVEKRTRFYFAMLLILETGVMGVFASFDLFLFILMWEIELIPMFLLIGIWGGQRREYAAWEFLLYTLVGSAFTLAGIFLIYFQTGGKDASFQHFAQTAPILSGTLPFFGGSIPLELTVFLLLFVGFAIKIPMWPLHTWLPDAHTEAPTAVSVLLAGVLLKMGAYGLIRICLGFAPKGAMEFAPVLGIIAAINVLWGAGASMVQKDMKRMIAYSSVSHMGYVLLGVAAAAAAGTASMSFRQAALTGATLQMFTHGTITGMLFFSVGALGLPGLSGFVAEYLVFTGSFATLPLATILSAFGVVLTAGYLLWMLRRSFYGPLNMKWDWLTDASALEAFPLIALTVVILFVGIYPKPMVDLLTPSLQQMLHSMSALVAR